MSFTNVSGLEQIRARVAKTLTAGIQLNMSTDESKKLLKRHVNKKTNVVIIFIDVNNSTEMSLSLPEDRFALMIHNDSDICSRNKYRCDRLVWICL